MLAPRQTRVIDNWCEVPLDAGATSSNGLSIRAAFGWLLIAGALIALEPARLAATGRPFSHAFIGAICHADTVGSISQMIIGVSLRVVNRMSGIPSELVKPLWATFWLLDLGNSARVGFETATDYKNGAFFLMGFAGLVELFGLILWGSCMASLMLKRRSFSDA